MLTSYITWRICQNQEINIGIIILMKSQIYLDLIIFSIDVLLLFEGPIQDTTLHLVPISLISLSLSFFCLFRGVPVAYRGSQGRGQIGTVADPSHVCDLYHSSWQHQILNPLSEAGDQTWNLMVPSRIRFHCATMGTPYVFLVSFPTVYDCEVLF